MGTLDDLQEQYIPENERLEPFGSDDFPFHFGMIFRFQPLVFWGVGKKKEGFLGGYKKAGVIVCLWTSKL